MFPRFDVGDDPIDFIRDKLRHGHILLASIYVTHLSWWDREQDVVGRDGNSVPPYPESWFRRASERAREAEHLTAATSVRSRRILRLYRATTGQEARSYDVDFCAHAWEVNRLLFPPSHEQIAEECEHLRHRAAAEGRSPAEFFLQKVEVNGSVLGDRHFGSHAVVITGYNDNDSTLEIRNSWGPTWKDRGYGYISYAYFRRFLQSYWSDDKPLLAYKPNLDSGSYHTSGHPLDDEPL